MTLERLATIAKELGVAIEVDYRPRERAKVRWFARAEDAEGRELGWAARDACASAVSEVLDQSIELAMAELQ